MSKKTVFLALGAVLIGAFFYFETWRVVVSSPMEKFCASLEPGLARPQLDVLARAQGYRISVVPKQPRVFVVDPRDKGRLRCDVEFRDDKLASAKYVKP